MPSRTPAQPTQLRPLLTHSQAAAYLGVPPGALHTQYSRKVSHLPRRYRFGNQWRYRLEDIEACLIPEELAA